MACSSVAPWRHAEIVSIDVDAALAAGALCVLTARDLPFNDKPWVTRYWHSSIRDGMPKFLPFDRVRFVGEACCFPGGQRSLQRRGPPPWCILTISPFPVLATVKDALALNAPQLHPRWTRNIAVKFEHVQGDPVRAMAAAAHRVRRTFSFVRQTPLALEPRGVVAEFDEARDGLTVWMSTQAHYNVRQNLAAILDIPEYQVRVLAEDVGGGIGAKSRTYQEEIVVSHASRLLHRPVKWIEDRFENLQATTHSRAIDVESS